MGDGEERAIRQAFMECQVHAEQMVSGNRCWDRDKKRNGIRVLALKMRETET